MLGAASLPTVSYTLTDILSEAIRPPAIPGTNLAILPSFNINFRSGFPADSFLTPYARMPTNQKLCMSCQATNLHKKWGFRRFQKERQKVRKTLLVRKKCGFAHFLVLFLESAETPLFVQINVFAVRALRLDRKYPSQKVSPRHQGRRKTNFLLWTSMIFCAHVNDSKGSRRALQGLIHLHVPLKGKGWKLGTIFFTMIEVHRTMASPYTLLSVSGKARDYLTSLG